MHKSGARGQPFRQYKPALTLRKTWRYPLDEPTEFCLYTDVKLLLEMSQRHGRIDLQWRILSGHKMSHAAVSCLLEVPDLRLGWTDAICTNRNDNLERNQQVSRTERIYEHTSRVYIWVGPGNEHLASALELI